MRWYSSKRIGVGGVGLFPAAGFAACVSPGFAEKQCPRFNFVPIKTHLTPMKVSLDVNGKFLFFSDK